MLTTELTMILGNPWAYYFDQTIHVVNQEGDEKGSRISSVAVSEYHDSLAVATYDGVVTVYFSNDKAMNNLSVVSTNILAPNSESYCSQICWQSNSQNHLIAGRADGQIANIEIFNWAKQCPYFSQNNSN